ncbi:hypothetical protein CDD80_4203 [Ophiocordyceps camponoti-rufipedis]|uniref:Uncharacterized protein n=1 Tax=Ophiocordyceps camponoti-rufipedis TaxID=2004952 RepID=A0A2C5YZS3_9HYPO|nr:hypothetical protein CDD80_4203 [Ophiocordyceps camponoti-rufipedis]
MVDVTSYKPRVSTFLSVEENPVIAQEVLRVLQLEEVARQVCWDIVGTVNPLSPGTYTGLADVASPTDVGCFKTQMPIKEPRKLHRASPCLITDQLHWLRASKLRRPTLYSYLAHEMSNFGLYHCHLQITQQRSLENSSTINMITTYPELSLSTVTLPTSDPVALPDPDWPPIPKQLTYVAVSGATPTTRPCPAAADRNPSIW